MCTCRCRPQRPYLSQADVMLQAVFRQGGMMGERTLAKAQRLGRVSHLLHRNPQGLDRKSVV